MAQQLRALAALSEDPGLSPSSYKMPLIDYNSSSGRQDKGIGLRDGGSCRVYYSFDNIGNLRKIEFEIVKCCHTLLWLYKKDSVSS